MSKGLCLIALLLGTAIVQAAPFTEPVAKPVATPVVAEPLAQKDGLKVSLGASNIELRRSDPHINVVLQNTSTQPINVFQEWNSWGAYNLTLEITSVDGKALDKPLVVAKGSMVWRANFPSADTIAPDEVLVREVRLQISKHFLDPSVPETSADLNPRGPFYWGFPVPEIDDLRRVTMRAVFANDDPKSDTGMEKKTVWTGRIASPFKEYKVSWDVDSHNFEINQVKRGVEILAFMRIERLAVGDKKAENFWARTSSSIRATGITRPSLDQRHGARRN